MKVKICGITCLEDALSAVEAGADLLGFNFYPRSPRYVRPELCAQMVKTIREHIGNRVILVGVFVNTGLEETRNVLDSTGLDLAQLSGDEPPSVVAGLGERAFKALRPNDAASLAASLVRYPQRSSAPAWLIDAYREGEFGGTGLTADWSLAASLARTQPVLLAGGLKPENVRQAILQVRPWGVDVASGVEDVPGKKDPSKMAAFIQAAREAAEELKIS